MATPIRVLILEDRPADAELMVYELERAGFEPDWQRVETQEDYLEKLRANPDVILADHTLPSFSAPQALELLKKTGLDIPLIMVTGSINEEVAVERMKQGASDYILKDRLARLGAAVSRALDEKKLRAEKHQAEDALRARYRELQSLHEISQIILNAPDLQTALDEILAKAFSTSSFDIGAILLLDAERDRLKVAVSRGYRHPENPQGQARDPVEGTTRSEVLTYREPRVIEDVMAEEGMGTLKQEGVQSAILVPVRAGEEILGLIRLGSRSRRQFQASEVRTLQTIGTQMGLAIQKARLYEELKKRLLELETANKIKDEFLSVMSHELRTPLNVIIGYTSLVEDGMLGEVNPRQKESLRKVQDRSNDLLGIVNNILYTTSLEAKVMRLDKHQVSIADFLSGLMSGYDAQPHSNLKLIWEIPSQLPFISTDTGKLKVILNNLISNAIKFTEKGKVTVSVHHFPKFGAVAFKVADTGIGIPKAAQHLIFEKFRQLDSSETRLYGGVGIGLYLVKRFTEMLGGRVEVESEPGKGSTFTVTIPDEQPK